MKNGNFVGQFDLNFENFEKKIIEHTLTATGYDFILNDNKITITLPTTLNYRNKYKSLISDFSEIYITLYKQIGWQSYSDRDKQYNAISYSAFIRTNGKIRLYRAKTTTKYETTKPYTYNTDLMDLMIEIILSVKREIDKCIE